MHHLLLYLIPFWYSKTNQENKFNIRSLIDDVKIETIIPKSGIWLNRCREIEKWTGGTCVLLKIQNDSNESFDFLTTPNTLIITNKKSFFFKNEKDNSSLIDGELVFRATKIKHSKLLPKQTGYYTFLIEPFDRYFELNKERSNSDINKLKSKELRKIHIKIADSDTNRLVVEVSPNKGFYFK